MGGVWGGEDLPQVSLNNTAPRPHGSRGSRSRRALRPPAGRLLAGPRPHPQTHLARSELPGQQSLGQDRRLHRPSAESPEGSHPRQYILGLSAGKLHH